MKRKKWPKVLVIVLVLAAAAAFAVPKLLPQKNQSALGSNMVVHAVETGDVSVTITGSGKLENADEVELELPVGVETAEIFVEEGDFVREGQLLATFDVDSLTERAAVLSSELSALDAKLMARKTVGEIVSPVKGRIKQINAVENDDVIERINESGCLALISTDGLMQVCIETQAELAMNDEVTVRWSTGMEDGVVAGKTADGYLITLSDEDAPYLAQATVFQEMKKIGSGTLELHAPLPIFGNGGTIEEIHEETDAEVKPGDELFTLSNAPAVDSYRQTLADRSEKARQLLGVLALQEQPWLVAPQDGLVQSLYLSEGDKTASADMIGDAPACTIGVGGAVKMSVDVDELDIRKVRVGQEVSVTLDAFAGESFSGKVEHISYIGQSAGSITTYAVEICLDADERLLPGMNGSAVILSETAKDALLVPLAAIYEDARGEYVLVLGEDGAQSPRYIETGLSDGTNAQVRSGLSKGEKVVYRGSVNMLQMMMESSTGMLGGMQ
ncbi:MAG: efflux RND transporter periplasmic adaptor subunit [Eubacteriales bacterium]|nr:efflux RND transporter periplasmic adaptor subunit [Eubacteriales bacterium]